MKPYNEENVAKCFVNAVLRRSRPTPYMTIMNLARQFLEMNKIDESILVSMAAEKMDPLPALQCFVMGQAYERKEDTKNATSCYVKGLRYNKFHYGCLNALYKLFTESKNEADSYKVLQRIASYFPVAQEQLESLITFALKNNKIADLEEYYNKFVRQRVASDALVKYIDGETVGFLSSLGTNHNVEKAKNMGARFFVDKPITYKKLLGDISSDDELLPDVDYADAIGEILNTIVGSVTRKFLADDPHLNLGVPFFVNGHLEAPRSATVRGLSFKADEIPFSFIVIRLEHKNS